MKSQTVRQFLLTTVLTTLIFSPAMLTTIRAQTAPAGFPDLVSGLKATPGCLGVETARTASGKQVIFAWFENKKAVLNWYYSDMHRELLERYSNGHRRPGGPLTGVPDEGPILAVASITIPTPPANGDLQGATTQIAIELYAPLPGGLAAGGRFAPATVKVPGLIEIPATASTKEP